eukprot:21678_5
MGQRTMPRMGTGMNCPFARAKAREPAEGIRPSCSLPRKEKSLREMQTGFPLRRLMSPVRGLGLVLIVLLIGMDRVVGCCCSVAFRTLDTRMGRDTPLCGIGLCSTPSRMRRGWILQCPFQTRPVLTPAT